MSPRLTLIAIPMTGNAKLIAASASVLSWLAQYVSMTFMSIMNTTPTPIGTESLRRTGTTGSSSMLMGRASGRALAGDAGRWFGFDVPRQGARPQRVRPRRAAYDQTTAEARCALGGTPCLRAYSLLNWLGLP